MNALTVICLAAVAACTTGQLLRYPGVYGYPGVLGAYPTLLTHGAPLAYNSFAPFPFTPKTVAPAPITFKTVAPAPITYKAAAPASVAYSVGPLVPVSPVTTQYHSQDELGQYSFGYSGGPSSRAETRDAFGVVRGSYNYVDSEGEVQTQHYVADALGFRVAGTNLPVAPDASETVKDTPEVTAQKAILKAAHEEAAALAAAAPESRKKRSVAVAPNFYSPLRFSYGFSSPISYSHAAFLPNHLPYTAGVPTFTNYAAGIPAFTKYAAAAPGVAAYTGVPAFSTYAAASPAIVRDAELLRVVHNPGHATSYRVYEA